MNKRIKESIAKIKLVYSAENLSIVHNVDYWLTRAYGNAKAKELLLAILADVYTIDLYSSAL